MIETPAPLTDDEVIELDSYGLISARQKLPARAIELWEREILWGRVTRDLKEFDGLIRKVMR